MGPSKPSVLSPITDVRATALDALSPDAETQAVVGTVLRELNSHHLAVRLDARRSSPGRVYSTSAGGKARTAQVRYTVSYGA